MILLPFLNQKVARALDPQAQGKEAAQLCSHQLLSTFVKGIIYFKKKTKHDFLRTSIILDLQVLCLVCFLVLYI